VRPGELPYADDGAKEGQFSPGSMIASVNGGTHKTATAGLFVEKGGERRLTCSYGLWEQQRREHPGLFGQDTDEAKRVFRLLRGDKPVGYAKERVADTAICLAKLDHDVEFENTFVGLPTPTVPGDLLAYADTFVPLVADGWSIVPVPDPRQSETLLYQRASHAPSPEESSSKRAAPGTPLLEELPLKRFPWGRPCCCPRSAAGKAAMRASL
jgi:hypothetical protein